MTPAPTVADAMVRFPKTCDAATTVAQVRRFFDDDHVHAALITRGDRLLAVVERGDLLDALPPDARACQVGRLRGRTIGPDVDAEDVRIAMVAQGLRRLAVVDDDSLRGLLCLSRTGRRFCSDADVADRLAERAALTG